ncbi:MAG: hypothetical protein JST69_02325 [Bacteroidetes bacterium]|nr:hypothetical protein [Bacteroidota bacterium]
MRFFIWIFFLTGTLSAQPAVMVFLHPRSDKPETPNEQLNERIKDHRANLQKMANEGKLLVNGSFDGGGGILIFNSNSADEVDKWLKTDPAIRSNQWRIEILPYQPRYGKPQAPSLPHKVVSYQWVRFTSYIAKFNVNDLPQLMQQHDEYLSLLKKSGNVVAEGIFNDTDGGVLVMKGDLDPAVIESDPAVRAGLLEFEIKKLILAKGAFGEK